MIVFRAAVRLGVCVAVVAGVVLLYVYATPARPGVVALTLLLPLLFISAAWGLRYALFYCVISAVAYHYLFVSVFPPPPDAVLVDPPWVFLPVITFLATGLTASHLSDRARREVVNAEERRAEAEAARRRFADLVNTVDGIVWEADPDTLAFSFVSEQAEAMLGFPTERWLRDPTFWQHHVHPEDRERAVMLRREAATARRRQDGEYRMLAADGRAVWVRDLVRPVVEDGRTVRLRGLLIDVTERKRVEATLRDHASLLDLTHDAIFVRDRDSVVQYWNRGAEQLYGWTAEEAAGNITHDLLKTVFPIPLPEIEVELLRTGRWEGEILHTRKDGTQLVAASRWSLQQDERGVPVAILETNNDVTERKRAEDALRRQANLLEQTHDAVFMWEFPGTIVYWNRGAERLYGFSRDEAIGRLPHDLLRTTYPLPTAEFDALLERDGAWNGELTHVTRDGRTIVLESRHVLMREPDGRRLVLETNRDLTDRKAAEQALQKAQATLTHVTRVTTLGEVTASLAHELNQPLAAIANNANACLNLLPADRAVVADVRDALSDIVADADRARAIIDTVRALAKRSTREDRRGVQLADIVADVVALVARESAARGVTIRIDVPADLPVVLGDRVQLQQVLLNLLVNAMDAMSGVEETERQVEIRGRLETDGAVVISVEDRGIGLEPGQTDRLFETFYTTKADGMGLGLAISRSIVEAHAGRLWAEPNRGRGATFAFSLPVAGRSSAAA